MPIRANRRPILPGQVFGYLTVVREDEPELTPWSSVRMALCECVCGKQRAYRAYNLWSLETKSCGCQKRKLWATTRNHVIEAKEYPTPDQWRKRVLIWLYEYILTTGCYKPTYFTRMNYLTKELLTLKP